MNLREFNKQVEFVTQHRTIVDTYQKITNWISILEDGNTQGNFKLGLDLQQWNQGLNKLEVNGETLLSILNSCRDCYKNKLENCGITEG